MINGAAGDCEINEDDEERMSSSMDPLSAPNWQCNAGKMSY